ncbi:MAG: hypothetical protein M9932_02875 [Xanthobacteraceae bacterium]|nr:hypothetical protein [Xanthobacteraceae bacterium]
MRTNWTQATNWRLSTFSGLLLAGYFVPAWGWAAWRIVLSPIHGLFERPNVAVAIFVSEHLQVPALTMVRVAWLLALGKLTVVAFFLLFAALLLRRAVRLGRGGDEALGIALGLGCVISFAAMMFAAQVHEAAALRLHATELMLLLGTAVLMLVDQPPAATAAADAEAANYGLSNPSS